MVKKAKRKYTFRKRKLKQDVKSVHHRSNFETPYRLVDTVKIEAEAERMIAIRAKAEAEAQAAIELAQFKQSIYKDPIVLQLFDYVNSAKEMPDHVLLAGAAQFGKETKTSIVSIGFLRILAILLREKLS